MSVTPVKIGGAPSTKSGLSSFSVPVDTSADVGDDVWAIFMVSGGHTFDGGISDSQGNVYTIDAQSENGTKVTVAVGHAKLTTALTGGVDTITGALGAGFTSARFAGTLLKVAAGEMALSPLDQAVTGSGSASPMSAGPTAALAQADELVIVGSAWSDSVSTETMGADAGYTLLDNEAATSGTNFKFLGVEWAETSSTAGVSAAPTINGVSAPSYATAIATYKVASAAPVISGNATGTAATAASAAGRRGLRRSAAAPSATAAAAIGLVSSPSAAGSAGTTGVSKGVVASVSEPALVQEKFGHEDTATTTSTLTVPATAAGHALVIAANLVTKGNRITGVTDSAGNVWRANAQAGASGGGEIEFWVAHNAASITSVTLTLQSSKCNYIFQEWSGVGTGADGNGSENDPTSLTAHLTPNITTTADGDLVLAGIGASPGTAAPFTSSAGWTESAVEGGSNGACIGLAWTIQAQAGTLQNNFTSSGGIASTAAVATIALKAATVVRRAGAAAGSAASSGSAAGAIGGAPAGGASGGATTAASATGRIDRQGTAAGSASTASSAAGHRSVRSSAEGAGATAGSASGQTGSSGGILVNDTFSRTLSGSLGSADTGQAITAWQGNSSDYAVDGSAAKITMPAGQAPIFAYAVDETEFDFTYSYSFDSAAAGSAQKLGPSWWLQDAQNYYRCGITQTTGGNTNVVVEQQIANVNTTVPMDWGSGPSTATHSLTAQVPGQKYWCRFRVEDVGGLLTFKVKVWKDGDSEPTTWLGTGTDIGGAPTHGQIGWRGQTTSGNTNTPTYSVDDALVTLIAATSAVTGAASGSASTGGAAQGRGPVQALVYSAPSNIDIAGAAGGFSSSDIPSGAQVGDLLIAHVTWTKIGAAGNAITNTAGGMTELGQTGDGTEIRQGIFYKTLAAGDLSGASFNFACAGSSSDQGGTILLQWVRNADPDAPFGTPVQAASSGMGISPTVPAAAAPDGSDVLNFVSTTSGPLPYSDSGCLFGMMPRESTGSRVSGSGITRLEGSTRWNRPISVGHSMYDWTFGTFPETTGTTGVIDDWNNNRLTFFSWPTQTSWHTNFNVDGADPTPFLLAIAQGAHDADIVAMASKLAAWGQPVWFRLFWEMNSGDPPWNIGNAVAGGATTQAAQDAWKSAFIGAWRRIYTILKGDDALRQHTNALLPSGSTAITSAQLQGALNVIVDWNPNSFDKFTDGDTRDDCWPGDGVYDYTDAVGNEGYIKGTDTNGSNTSITTMEQIISFGAATSAANEHVPMTHYIEDAPTTAKPKVTKKLLGGNGEGGIRWTGSTDTTACTSRAQSMLPGLENHPQWKTFVYWDGGSVGSNGQSSMDDGAGSVLPSSVINALQAWAADPYMNPTLTATFVTKGSGWTTAYETRRSLGNKGTNYGAGQVGAFCQRKTVAGGNTSSNDLQAAGFGHWTSTSVALNPAGVNTSGAVQGSASGRATTAGSANGSQPGTAPANTVAPTLSTDAPIVGGNITCNPGTWTGAPDPAITYQWQHYNGSAWVVVSGVGATVATYTVDATDQGFPLRCKVTGTNASGSASALSEQTADVAAGGVGGAATAVLVTAGDLVNTNENQVANWLKTNYYNNGAAVGFAIAGDNAYQDGSSSNFTSEFDPAYGGMLFDGSGKQWIFPSTGSHDFGAWGAGGAVGNGITGYKSYLHDTKGITIWDSAPPASPNPPTTPYNSYYYHTGTVRNGPGSNPAPLLDPSGAATAWCVINVSGVKAVTTVKDSDGLVIALAAGSAQHTWLSNALSFCASNNLYAVIVCAHALYTADCSGAGGGHAPEPKIQPLWDLLASTGMLGKSVVIGGHNHNYQRFLPQDAAGVAKADDTGTVQFVVGTAGLSGGYTADSTPANWATKPGGGNAYSPSIHGALELTLKPTGYDFRFINSADGSVFDSGSVTLAPIHIGSALGTATGSASTSGAAAGGISAPPATGTAAGSAVTAATARSRRLAANPSPWQKVVSNGGRANAVIADPTTPGRALGVGDVFGQHTTRDGGVSWFPRMKGRNVNSSGTAGQVYGRTGCWSRKTPGVCYVGNGTLKNGAGGAYKIDLNGADPFAQSDLLGSIGFDTSAPATYPSGGSPGGTMPRIGCGQLMDIWYPGSGAEYLFAAHNAGISYWADEAAPVSLLSGTFDGAAQATDAWKALIVVDESGPVIYATTYGLGGYSSTVHRIGNPLGTPAHSTLAAAPAAVHDFATDGAGALYACGGSNIWAVTGSGATWTAIDGGATAGRTVASLAYANRNGVPTIVAIMADQVTTGHNILIGTESGGSWSWAWANPNVWQDLELSTGEPYWLNGAGNRLLSTTSPGFAGALVRFDADGDRVYIGGTGGLYITPDFFANVYPSGYGFGGSESTNATSTGPSAFGVNDQDWNGIATSDAWNTYGQTAGSGGASASLTATVGGDTYALDASSAPAKITKNGVDLSDDYFRGACVAPNSIAVDANGVISVALYGGGVLRYEPPVTGLVSGAGHGAASTAAAAAGRRGVNRSASGEASTAGTAAAAQPKVAGYPSTALYPSRFLYPGSTVPQVSGTGAGAASTAGTAAGNAAVRVLGAATGSANTAASAAGHLAAQGSASGSASTAGIAATARPQTAGYPRAGLYPSPFLYPGSTSPQVSGTASGAASTAGAATGSAAARVLGSAAGGAASTAAAAGQRLLRRLAAGSAATSATAAGVTAHVDTASASGSAGTAANAAARISRKATARGAATTSAAAIGNAVQVDIGSAQGTAATAASAAAQIRRKAAASGLGATAATAAGIGAAADVGIARGSAGTSANALGFRTRHGSAISGAGSSASASGKIGRRAAAAGQSATSASATGSAVNRVVATGQGAATTSAHAAGVGTSFGAASSVSSTAGQVAGKRGLVGSASASSSTHGASNGSTATGNLSGASGSAATAGDASARRGLRSLAQGGTASAGSASGAAVPRVTAVASGDASSSATAAGHRLVGSSAQGTASTFGAATGNAVNATRGSASGPASTTGASSGIRTGNGVARGSASSAGSAAGKHRIHGAGASTVSTNATSGGRRSVFRGASGGALSAGAMTGRGQFIWWIGAGTGMSDVAKWDASGGQYWTGAGNGMGDSASWETSEADDQP